MGKFAGFFKRLKNLDETIRTNSKKAGDKVLRAVGKGLQTVGNFVTNNSSSIGSKIVDKVSNIPLIGNVASEVISRTGSTINQFGQGLSNIGYNRSTVKDELNNFGKHLYNTYPSGAFIAPFRIGNSISNATVGQELRNQFNDTMKYLF